MAKIDVLPGYKTKVTAVIIALLNTLAALDVISITPELVTEINQGLLGLIGLFLAMKIDRKKSE